MSKRSRNVALGTLLFALAGYIAGLLTAPKSGKETRRDVQRQAQKAKLEAEKTLKNLHSELSAMITKGKSKAGKAKTTTKAELGKALDKAQRAKDKAREILSAVHEGDAEDEDLQKAIKEVNDAMLHLKNYVGKNDQTKK